MPDAKTSHAMVSYFAAQYKKKYGKAPIMNRYAARWGFDSMLRDMPQAEVKSLVDYYFTTNSPNGHQLDWFFYNYEKLMRTKLDFDADQEELAKIREATRKRTEEWKKKRGNG